MVSLKKKSEGPIAAAAPAPAVAPSSDTLRDALQDPLSQAAPTEKKSEALGNQSNDKDAPTEASVIPTENADEKIVVVEAAAASVVVTVDEKGEGQVVSESKKDAVPEAKVEEAVNKAVEIEDEPAAAAAAAPADVTKVDEDQAVSKRVKI